MSLNFASVPGGAKTTKDIIQRIRETSHTDVHLQLTNF